MIYKPHSYQEYATQWILDKEKVGLLMDMGLGKTVVTLTAIQELMHDYFDIIKALVIAPLRVAEDTWSSETEKWDHLKYLKISKVLGTEKERVAALNTTADIYVINRENVVWLVKYYGKDWPFDMVVIDELSSFKSSKSQRFKALRKVKARRIVGLTGTPAPNGLMDLWSEMYLLDGGERLGKTMTGYRERYFNPDKRNQNVIFSYKPKEGAKEHIYEKLKDICVSMKVEDYLKLPEKINNIIKIKLSKIAMDKYKQLERDLFLPLKDSDIVANNAAVLTNKLLQMANGAIYDENGDTLEIHDEKLKALEDIIEAANEKPVLIFYSYKHDRDRLQKYFKVKELKTSKDIKAWNRGEIPIMLVHPASAGHGLNLQGGGNIIVWFGLTWSLELYQQANARLYRQGQKQNVIIHHLVAKGTMDEDVMKALQNKEVGQDALLQAVKARLNKIND
ncbi:SNF2-related protein [Clostridium scatologenes]|uniref:SNF2-related protein n=1 Tax=Clostridium scatologenes TaxID=1548 RepID=A0A0E3M961_CLOSL|nr:DEAD/DEAH box helicase [Clostridium scatologenes]AKA72322.1 SNF2-related protein [Clostridium scatologenes]